MDHNHVLVDQDDVFSIEVDSREIVLFDSEGNEVVDPILLVQGDHNSERFTFEIPRTIESHDMSLCNRVQVHYLNIGRNGEQSPGIYDVPAEDLFVDPEDDTVVICSWLISDVATKYEGSLNFAIRYACYAEGSNKPEYAFNTKPYTNVVVAAGINNAGAVVERYGDILESWYQKFIDAEDSSLSAISEAKETGLTAIAEAKDTSLTTIDSQTETKIAEINTHVETTSKPDIAAYVEEQKETFVSDAANAMRTEILNEFGERVTALESKNVEQVATVNGKTLKFFVGETSEYNAYEEKDDLLALLTDDTSKTDLSDVVDKVTKLLNGDTAAKKAEQDAESNVISTTYTKKTDFNPVSDNVTGLLDGNKTAKKASQDGAGRSIVDTYVEKTALTDGTVNPLKSTRAMVLEPIKSLYSFDSDGVVRHYLTEGCLYALAWSAKNATFILQLSDDTQGCLSSVFKNNSGEFVAWYMAGMITINKVITTVVYTPGEGEPSWDLDTTFEKVSREGEYLEICQLSRQADS